MKWRYFNPAQAPVQKMWNWSVDRRYPQEDLPWEEQTWSLKEVKQGNAVGYTLQSFQCGSTVSYDNLYHVIRNRGRLLVTPAQVRKQIVVLEECHRQNRLPKVRQRQRDR